MRVTIIGTGSMGSAIAESLLACGREVTVFNRTAVRAEALRPFGARIAVGVAEAIADSDAVILAVFDAAAVRETIAEPRVTKALRGKPFLNIAATTPNEIAELASEFAEHDARLSELAICAYPTQVRARNAEFLLAATDPDRATWCSLFTDLGKVHDIGEIGNASRGEMALWLPYMFQTIAIAYGLGAFERLGLPDGIVRSVLSKNPILAVAGADELIPDMAARTYGDKLWSVDNFSGSAGHIIEFARSIGLPTEPLQTVRDLYDRTSRAGLGQRDVTAIYESFGKER